MHDPAQILDSVLSREDRERLRQALAEPEAERLWALLEETSIRPFWPDFRLEPLLEDRGPRPLESPTRLLATDGVLASVLSRLGDAAQETLARLVELLYAQPARELYRCLVRALRPRVELDLISIVRVLDLGGVPAPLRADLEALVREEFAYYVEQWTLAFTAALPPCDIGETRSLRLGGVLDYDLVQQLMRDVPEGTYWPREMRA